MDIKKEIIGYAKVIVCGIIIAIILNKFVIINANITSESMLPTLSKGDKLIGNRLSYLFSEPERGDIIIFESSVEGEGLLVKRVIGLPTEVITIIDGKVYIGDSKVPLSEPYVVNMDDGNYGPYIIPVDCYFVMGDNRVNSLDSRFFLKTFVSKKQIVARPLFKYYKNFESVK